MFSVKTPARAALVACTLAVVGFFSNQPANAQKFDERPSWTGFYVGAHLGYGWGDWNVDLSGSSGAIHYNDPFLQTNEQLGANNGVLGGLQIGANKQFGAFVGGIEVDVSWTGLDADGRFTTPKGSQWDIKSSLDMLGTVRGRLGVTTGPALLFVTAGFAWAQVDTDQATNFLAPPDTGGRTSGTNYHFGYVIGGGAEWMLGGGWSLKGEYLYIDLGEQDYALRGTTKPNGNVPYTETFAADMQFHTLRVGLNYRF